MHYDVAIIGAGMSGLAAGIRLAYFDKRVCIFERHEQFGGLNSFYRLDGREFDVGLHAVTNFAGPRQRNAPLNKLLRQLRINRDELDIHEQGRSAIVFPGRRLQFSNDFALLESEVAATFPRCIDAFRRLVADLRAYDDVRLDVQPRSARDVLAGYFDDPVFIDMLLCGPMFYGNPSERDMDFTHFVTMFKSLFLEGFWRPRGGVRTIIRLLVRKYRELGGKFRMNCGVRAIRHDGRRAAELELDDGQSVSAGHVLSSIGRFETMELCGETREVSPSRNQAVIGPHTSPLPGGAGTENSPASIQPRDESGPGRLTFMESISILDQPNTQLDINDTIIFFNNAERFDYRVPDSLVDPISGVICCPTNFRDHGHAAEGVVRLTSLANYERWASLSDDEYRAQKQVQYARVVAEVVKVIPDFRGHVTYTDIFTPRTIHRYTGHLYGAVYGAPEKVRDGRTFLHNLYLCGTDQGYLGIIGALLSGVTMANLHVLDPR